MRNRSVVARLAGMALAAMLAGCGAESRQSDPRVRQRMIVLGIDGMDPAFLERHWDSLPNLDRLRREGEFKRLATTMPPQSPVAWSTFITGLDPDGHGIYDFVGRDPATRMPRSSMSEIQPGRKLTIGPYVLPLTADRIVNQRQGVAFWELLSAAGIPSTILRMPTDFPPIECEAHSLSGMGTPDLLGTFGTFAYFTSHAEWKDRKLTGGAAFVVSLQNHSTVLRLNGPSNPLRRTGETTQVEIRVDVDPTESAARFDVGGRLVVLKQGELSGWIPVSFPLLPAQLAGARGMIRIYAQELHPGFAVYVSPVNIDPRDPVMPLSHPDSYGADLAKATGGAYYTQGLPYDTAAFRHGVFSRAEYRAHSREVSRQTLSLLRAAVSEFRSGLLFFHFFGVDQDSHMLWGRYEDELLETYRMLDEALGWVRERAGGATLLLMSDHGFARFDRAVHLNTWLMREGFLRLQQPGLTGGDELFANVDWTRTRAYALGLNSIYVNRPQEDEEDLLAEIEERLLGLRDPVGGNPVVLSVARPHGGANAPALIAGYAPGYRGSWQTALGAVPGVIVEDNTDEWRGDHCMNPQSVPGVLLSSRPIGAGDPRIEDLTVTVLEAFGVKPPPGLKGRNLFAPTRQASMEKESQR